MTDDELRRASAGTPATPGTSRANPGTSPGAGASRPDPGPDVELPAVVGPPPDYSESGVPSLDYVRDKIEGRYAHSLGATELAQGTPEVTSFEEQAAKREEAARDKLEEIRRSLRGGSTS